MISRVDERLRAEARAFRLAFRCDECVAFDPGAGRCAYGYPTEPHRGVDLDARREVVFCKAFELA